jgi:plastocyanin
VSAITPLRAFAGVIAVAMLIAAPASAVPPKKTTITIAGMAYSGSPVTVRVGDTVEWVNKDVVDHTATEKTAAGKDALWDVSIAPGKSATVVMKTRGSFDYFCRYHPNMVARLTVK